MDLKNNEAQGIATGNPTFLLELNLLKNHLRVESSQRGEELNGPERLLLNRVFSLVDQVKQWTPIESDRDGLYASKLLFSLTGGQSNPDGMPTKLIIEDDTQTLVIKESKHSSSIDPEDQTIRMTFNYEKGDGWSKEPRLIGVDMIVNNLHDSPKSITNGLEAKKYTIKMPLSAGIWPEAMKNAGVGNLIPQPH